MGRRDDTGALHSVNLSMLLSWVMRDSIKPCCNLNAQNFITFVDALKLRMRAKDQLHPILQELVTSYARFKGSKDWEGRSKMVGWSVSAYLPVGVIWDADRMYAAIRRLITLNGMKASEELTEEQARQASAVIVMYLATLAC